MGMDVGADGQQQQQPLECIDMASPEKLATAAQVRQACASFGFFYLVNHGVDADLLDEVFAQSKKFFSLPLAEKEKVHHDKAYRGYTPFGGESLDPAAPKGDSKEGYNLGVHVPESDPRSKLPLHGPNQYPSSDVLPGWQETMDRYNSELIKLSRRVCRLIALALQQEETYFEKPGIADDPLAFLKLLHYNEEKSNVEQGFFGTGAHSDYGLVTLLATDDVPGLQICRDKDAVIQVWEDVPPMKGAFIVNLGDMVERWSNGLFRSTLHRVVTQGIERYSIPFFFFPNFDCLVECLPVCSSEDNPPKYPPITCEEHMMTKFYAAAHKGFASGKIKIGSYGI